ncbi:MAG TPA: CpaF family protein [Symbiobacteriaceae bacterium]
MAERTYLRDRAAAVLPIGVGSSQDEAVSYLQRRVDEALAGDPEVRARYVALRDRVRERLLQEIEPDKLFRPHDRNLMLEMHERIAAILERDELDLPVSARRAYCVLLVQDLVGFGPVQPLIDDPEVTEILINRYDDVWVERNGRLERVPHIRFDSDQQVRELAERIALPLRRRIDELNPILDARLPDGSRVCATLHPPALDGTVIAIRKFSRQMLGLDGLKAAGTLSDESIRFLRRCVRARCSILVVGGTSSGKTTILNALSSFIPSDERVITIEDAAELQLQQPHVVRYETRQGNAEGRGEISIRDLVRTALRLRPDRIVVGEVRGREALDMIQANNTGHDGGFSTLHANSARDALNRLEAMVLQEGHGIPIMALRQQIASAFDLIISCVRLRDGRRRIAEIVEIDGLEQDSYRLRTLWQYDAQTDQLLPTGEPPQRLTRRWLWHQEEG